MSYAEEHWRKIREQIPARHAALAERGLNIFGDPLGTDYSYKRASLDDFSDKQIATEHAKRLARKYAT